MNYARNDEQANEVVAKIQQSGRRALAIQADVSDSNQVETMFSTVEQSLGSIDVLVNNAGIMKLQKVEEVDDETFNQIIDVNLKGTFNTLRLAALRLNDYGRIVNFSTSAIALALPGYAIYNASKAAVEALSYTFAKELRGRHITVNCIAPGPTCTDLFLEGKTEEQISQLAKMSPLERLGSPEEIANVVSFLVGRNGEWINAQVLRANGGIV
ncbi:MAG: SDR family oxidoreductase [Methylococcales bacterium]|nr:SDR family oxidoreductase [Methylococcales bacterium]MDD5754137.1 SDR family oxidoreductase [Methylococcales bacterium]